jgi:hypothetical protein
MAAVREIKFLCVARKTDKVVLASRTHTADKVSAPRAEARARARRAPAPPGRSRSAATRK